MCSNETSSCWSWWRERPSAAPAAIKPAQTPNPFTSIHRENRPSHNYSSRWNGNYPLNESGAVPLIPDFPCWEGNVCVAERRPFRKHLIANGCFIPCDIYENFMDGSCFSLWHFRFPLKVWMWWLFFSPPTKTINENNSCSDGVNERVMREMTCFHLFEKGYKARGDGDSSLWFGNSFHWLLTVEMFR